MAGGRSIIFLIGYQVRPESPGSGIAVRSIQKKAEEIFAGKSISRSKNISRLNRGKKIQRRSPECTRNPNLGFFGTLFNASLGPFLKSEMGNRKPQFT
jgi:hypothetical protein